MPPPIGRTQHVRTYDAQGPRKVASDKILPGPPPTAPATTAEGPGAVG
ncbi:hypothetical protein OG723_14695 [Streptomyces sp. NBC_01278]|nr:hypothetical protein [Streptomyces sp. NBC_01278]